MLRRVGWLGLASFLALGWPRAAGADALRKVDRAASGGGHGHGSGGSSGGGGSSHHHESHHGTTRSYYGSSYRYGGGPYYGENACDRYGNCPTGSFGLLFLMYTLGLPWTVPRLYESPDLGSYAPYPFFDGPGYVRPSLDAPGVVAGELRNVVVALDFESGYQIEGVVPATVNMRLLLPYRFEVDSRVSLLSDVHEHPTQIAASGTNHISYRFAQGPRFDARTGIGTRMFTLDTMRWGVDLVYALDFYIARGWVLRMEGHVGTLSKALAGQVRGTLGWMLGPCELYVGYDHSAFHGSVLAKLSGPIAGARWWF